MPKRAEYTSNSELESAFKGVTLQKLESQARGGVPAAQTELARRYWNGIGTPTNTAAALEWYRKAATNESPLAQVNLAQIYEFGLGLEKDLTAAIDWYRRASEGGLPFASHRLGWLCFEKASKELDPREALRLYELAAEQGDLEAAHRLAYAYWRPPGGGTIHSDLAIYWCHYAALKGYTPAYCGVGWYYMESQTVNGRLTDPDYQEAERWFRMGVERNDPGCEFGMAMLELTANKTSPNLDEVRKWLLKAAAKNFTDAFYQLGRLSEFKDIAHDPSLKPDYSEAAEWYRRAADANHRWSAARLAELTASGKIGSSGEIIASLRLASDLKDMKARVELAIRYLHGEATPRNDSDAPLRLLESAYRAGNARAMVQLSDLHRTGTLVTRDPIQSIHFLLRALAYGNEEAFERLMQFRPEAGTQAPRNLGPEDPAQALIDYTSAVYTFKPEGAALIARRYLDGTYPTNSVQAAVWYSLAGYKKDESAAAEAKRLQQGFDNATREQVEKQAQYLLGRSSLPNPVF